jgi:transposase, IS5 family
MRRLAAVEPVIGRLKDGHRMGRNHHKGREGDRINAVPRRRRLQLQPAAALV